LKYNYFENIFGGVIVKKIVGVLVVVMVLLFTTVVISEDKVEHGRNLKIGYVNIEKVIESYTKWNDLQDKYKNDVDYYNSKINALKSEIDALQKSGDQTNYNQKVQELQTRVNQYQQELQNEYGEKTNALIDEVKNIVVNYAKDNGYDLMVYDSGAIYASDLADLTETMINIVNSSK